METVLDGEQVAEFVSAEVQRHGYALAAPEQDGPFTVYRFLANGTPVGAVFVRVPTTQSQLEGILKDAVVATLKEPALKDG